MSDFVSKKAIRYKLKEPLTDEQQEEIWERYMSYKTPYSLKKDYNLNYDMEYDSGVDYDTYKSEDYLDIVLKSTYGTICGYFGNSREITEEEASKYLPDFQKVVPTATKEDLRYVFYCYYNGTDAPCCYDVGEWNDGE